MQFSDWVRMRLRVLGHSGNELNCICPFNGCDRFYVNVETNSWICFRCQKSGRGDSGAEFLVSKVDGVSREKARQKVLADATPSNDDLADLLAAGGRGRGQDQTVVVDQPLPAEFIPCFDGRAWHVPLYARARGLNRDILLRHGIGYAVAGRYRDRLIFPVFCAGSRTWVGRLMGDPSKFRYKSKKTGLTIEPSKYHTPKDAFTKHMLYWYDHLPVNAIVIIVEGILDAIRLIDLGFYAVATFGKEIGEEQIDLLKAKRPRKIFVMYDGSAFQQSVEAALRLLRSVQAPIAACRLPEKDDPDTFGRNRGARAVREILSSSHEITDELDAMALMLGD